jgi:DNA polymerase V
MANSLAKTSGGTLCLMMPSDIQRTLTTVDVRDIWGVGSRHARRLKSYGIRTAADLTAAQDTLVRRALTITGLRTVHELRGIPCIDLEHAPPARQTICTSRAFGRPLFDLEELQEAISSYTAHAAQKLRSQHSCARGIDVFVRTSLFMDSDDYSNSSYIQLPVASDDNAELIAYAHAALEKIYRPGYRYKKAGVLFTNLCHRNSVQPDLFDDRNRDRRRALMDTMDRINATHGRRTIVPLSSGIHRPWLMNQNRLSPRYTSCWDDLPTVM